jgi:hypothetical protein
LIPGSATEVLQKGDQTANRRFAKIENDCAARTGIFTNWRAAVCIPNFKSRQLTKRHMPPLAILGDRPIKDRKAEAGSINS